MSEPLFQHLPSGLDGGSHLSKVVESRAIRKLEVSGLKSDSPAFSGSSVRKVTPGPSHPSSAARRSLKQKSHRTS